MESSKSLAWAITLTSITFIAKLTGGYLTNSLALMSDAWHLLTDLLSLILSWWAVKLAGRKPNSWATFGFHRAGILAALVNNITLIAVSFYILYQAYLRSFTPQPVESGGMFVMAIIGMLVNGSIVMILRKGAKYNLNVRSTWLHFMGDIAADIGVLLGGIIIYFTGWYSIDTLLSAILGLTILRGAVIMLKDITFILLEGIPGNLSVNEIAASLQQLPNITAARDIHVWYLAEEEVILSAHIEIANDILLSHTGPMLSQIKALLFEKFHITHIHIQFELHECSDCYDRAPHKMCSSTSQIS